MKLMLLIMATLVTIYLSILVASVLLVRASNYQNLDAPNPENYTQINVDGSHAKFKADYWKSQDVPILLIHGNMYDREDDPKFDPEKSIYPELTKISPLRQYIGVSWSAFPPRFDSVISMWMHGCLYWSCRTQKRAREIALPLVELLTNSGIKEIDIVCHSMGCETAAKIIQQGQPIRVRKVIMLQPSLSVGNAKRWLDQPSTKILNVIVPSDWTSRIDDILKLASFKGGSIALRGIPEEAACECDSIVLKLPSTDEIQSKHLPNNPLRQGRHMVAIDWPDYRKIYSDFLGSGADETR